MLKLANTGSAPEEDARRRSLTVDATAQISDLCQAVRAMIGPSSDATARAVKVLMVRIEKLSDAILYTVDAGWEKALDDVAEIVNEVDGENAHG